MITQTIGMGLKPPIYVFAIVPAHAGGADTFGTDPGGLGTIASGRFAAVVGDGPGTESLSRGREDLAPLLLSHQRTIEQIMRSAPLLPVKFGTFVPDERSVRAILERGAPAFEAAFSRLDGCVQMEILVKWDVGTVFAAIANEGAVACLKEELELQAGVPEQVSRAALGRLVKESLERRRAALAGSLSDALQAIAVDAILYPATADRVVLHQVLLIKAGEMAALDTCLEALDAAHDGRLTFRCIGPLAPYSFATVEIEIVDAAALSQAMRLFDVGPTASAAEMRAAYRRLAKSAHPDAAGADAGGCASMVALTEAYRIVSLNAETYQGQRGVEDVSYVGNPHFADRSVLVSVRRQEQAFDAAV